MMPLTDGRIGELRARTALRLPLVLPLLCLVPCVLRTASLKRRRARLLGAFLHGGRIGVPAARHAALISADRS